jgi:hypothetical protein
MSMNWADSSDDEDETFFAPENNPPVPNEPNQDEEYEEHEADEPPESGRARKDFVLPERPPYTAFIGNLAFSVKDPLELAEKISNLVKSRFGEDIVITAQRIAIDWKDNNNHKGFGYVEVETLDHVSSLSCLSVGLPVVRSGPWYCGMLGGIPVCNLSILGTHCRSRKPHTLTNARTPFFLAKNTVEVCFET